VIEMLSTIAHGVCQNCGGPIVQLQGDMSARPYWCHEPTDEGRLLRECPGTLYAVPSPNHPVEPQAKETGDA
jgi:hypothetical protein